LGGLVVVLIVDLGEGICWFIEYCVLTDLVRTLTYCVLTDLEIWGVGVYNSINCLIVSFILRTVSTVAPNPHPTKPGTLASPPRSSQTLGTEAYAVNGK
jgi:hypothetical protein